MPFRPRIAHVLLVGVFIGSNCAEERSPVGPAPPVGWASTARPPISTPEMAIESGFATYYARRLAGRPTANGERYDPSQLTAAHRTLPFGTMIEVRRADGRKVVVRINDRGPYASGRIIDLSQRAAEELGIVREGKGWVELRRLAPQAGSPAITGGR